MARTASAKVVVGTAILGTLDLRIESVEPHFAAPEGVFTPEALEGE